MIWTLNIIKLITRIEIIWSYSWYWPKTSVQINKKSCFKSRTYLFWWTCSTLWQGIIMYEVHTWELHSQEKLQKQFTTKTPILHNVFKKVFSLRLNYIHGFLGLQLAQRPWVGHVSFSSLWGQRTKCNSLFSQNKEPQYFGNWDPKIFSSIETGSYTKKIKTRRNYLK